MNAKQARELSLKTMEKGKQELLNESKIYTNIQAIETQAKEDH